MRMQGVSEGVCYIRGVLGWDRVGGGTRTCTRGSAAGAAAAAATLLCDD